ncbi:hypothetical protein F5J12DRAFT_783941 [Pisolithus orientalis]|uniref:uncharacterized protein n=1 Tax=Pisolithus orientalis TaxID=936130 RepID=UPI00222453D0|nr:uncharacterized protein F5J12DRAFT_783941 [Pisolithus orientalis]KAI6002174.1 hypothetical protein F5J12DRAFT_783941 [Pisolithus orientalis]
MSTTNTSTFIPAQSTDNIQLVITTENAKQMVEEAARVTMQVLRGLWGQDAKHWGKVAQLVWAQLDHAWYHLHHQPKSHPYYKVMEELTRPSSRAKHQAQPVDEGKGKELGMDEAQRIWLPGSKDAPTDTTARTTGVAMQKLGNEEDQNREKAWGHSQSRHGQPVAKPVNASDQTSRGWSQSRRPMKKAKLAVDKDVQDWQDINNPPESWVVMLEAEHHHPSPGPWTGCPMGIITPSWLSQSQSHARSVATDPPITPAPTTTTGANDPCHCDKYQEEVTILKQENADMRQEIEVTHTELTALHWVVDAICNHLFLTPDMLNHLLVPFHTTCNPTPVPHMPVMVELGTATSVVEVQSS